MQLIANKDLFSIPIPRLRKLEQSHSSFEILFKPNITDYDTAISLLLFFHQNLENSTVSLHNVPPCLKPDFSEHIHNPPDMLKSKPSICKECRYNEDCGGIYRDHNIQVRPVPDIPQELIIEITRRCNLDCFYCFNSFKREGNELSLPEIKQHIDEGERLGIPFFRLTGGEPLLREDLFEVLDYAKGKFKEIRLNTNGQLIDKSTGQKLAQYVYNVLIPLNAPDPETEKKITGHDSFEKKKQAIRLLKEAGVPVVRSGTIALEKNIDEFETLRNMAKELDAWEWYRPVSKEQLVSTEKLKELIDILYEYKKKGEFYPIANALPFCFYDTEKVNEVALGAKFDDGHSRIVLSPEGYYKPSYFLDMNLGANLKKAWKNQKHKLHTECIDCIHRKVCKGGSRLFEKDPLMKQFSQKAKQFKEIFDEELKSANECSGYYIGRSKKISIEIELFQILSKKYRKFTDMGCGYGTESILAATLGFDVLAVDKNLDRLHYLLKRKREYEKIGSLNIRTKEGIYDEDLPETDIIFFKNSIYFSHTHPNRELFAQCKKALSENGLMVFNTIDRIKGETISGLMEKTGLITYRKQLSKTKYRDIGENKKEKTARFLTLGTKNKFPAPLIEEVDRSINRYHTLLHEL
ncbi:MAG: radical SAM protein [Candidatus Woesearchaeota archaeon]